MCPRNRKVVQNRKTRNARHQSSKVAKEMLSPDTRYPHTTFEVATDKPYQVAMNGKINIFDPHDYTVLGMHTWPTRRDYSMHFTLSQEHAQSDPSSPRVDKGPIARTFYVQNNTFPVSLEGHPQKSVLPGYPRSGALFSSSVFHVTCHILSYTCEFHRVLASGSLWVYNVTGAHKRKKVRN